MIKSVNHIAIAVRDLEATVARLRQLIPIGEVGYTDAGGSGGSGLTPVRMAFLKIGGLEMELIRPQTESGNIAQFLAAHGEGVHHIAVDVEDIEAFLDQLRKRDVKVPNRQPLQGAFGRKILYLTDEPIGGIHIQLCQGAK